MTLRGQTGKLMRSTALLEFSKGAKQAQRKKKIKSRGKGKVLFFFFHFVQVSNSPGFSPALGGTVHITKKRINEANSAIPGKPPLPQKKLP